MAARTGLCGTSWSLLAIAVSSMAQTTNTLRRFVVLRFMVTFLASMQGCLGTVTWLALSEMFRTHVRGVAMGICVFVLWMVNFLIGFFFPQMVARIGVSATFLILVAP
jgi:major inositol transporter-like SP family MFS transporter